MYTRICNLQSILNSHTHRTRTRTYIIMDVRALVVFLQLAVVHFRTEMLVLFGDARTVPLLIGIGHQLNASAGTTAPLQTIVYQIPFRARPSCRICPTSRLTIVWTDLEHTKLSHASWYGWYTDANRVVVVAERPYVDKEMHYLAQNFLVFNVVLVQLMPRGANGGQLRILCWGASLTMKANFTSTFNTTAAFFASTANNALVLRKQVTQWSAFATFSTTLIAPYHVIVQGPGTDGRRMLASAMMHMMHLLRDILNYTLTVHFTHPDPKECATCFAPLPLATDRRMVPLFDLDKLHLLGNKKYICFFRIAYLYARFVRI